MSRENGHSRVGLQAKSPAADRWARCRVADQWSRRFEVAVVEYSRASL